MATYKIQQGDTLSSIAKKYNTSVSALASANGIINPNLIIAGDTLRLPSSNGNVGIDLTGGASSGYQRGEFKPSDEYNTANTNATNAKNDRDALGDFSWINQGKLDEYTSKYENRDPFSYDFNTDALYQQYKDKYIKQAKMASADVMGQAAAMTGGYGNSYSQTVGNQAYQANLEQLNDVIPELYQLAYDKYNQEGQDLLNMISLMRGERDFDKGLHTDKYNRLTDDWDHYATEANNLYNRDYTVYSDDEAYKYGSYRDSVEDQQWQDSFDLAKQQYEDSKLAQAGVTYKASVDKSGKPVATPVVDEKVNTATLPSKVVKGVQNYTTKDGQAEYLAKQVTAGIITEEQAFQILDEHGVVPLTERSWEMVDNGGVNWLWGVDNNAVVRDENGNEYTLKELTKELQKTMSSGEAKNYVKKLQKQLGI